MVRELEGGLAGEALSIAIAVSRFNEEVTTRLLDGALDGLKSHGVRERNITVVWVPGSFEIPLVAERLARSDNYQAVVCLGAVIKKETAHFEHVSQQVARGIATVSRVTGKPVIFGVLTTYTEEQALERSGGSQGNRGYDAALAAIRMANLLKEQELRL